jgi:hypothetical protein
MSIRALIGMVQALLMPGNCSALSISAVSESTVTPGRHWSSGFRLMMVSNISTGAGSVAVAARPALPNTLATSGKLLMMRSETCSSSTALVTDMPGTLTGMYISVPSFSVGINSEPSCLSGITVAASTSRAIRMVAIRARRTPAMTGR